jgi:carboxypeptidase PM20D1
MRRVLLVLGLMILAVAVVVVARTAQRSARQVRAAPPRPVAVDDSAAAARLAQAVRFKTVSYEDSAPAGGELLAFHAFLQRSFPKAHAALKREVVGDYSLLYTWAGSDERLEPVGLMSHMDVVPVEPGSEGSWTHPPFAGEIADGFVWGRGTLDDKIGVLALLESVETLIVQGFHPRRTIYLAFGCDEEMQGNGAARIARLLRERGVRPEFVLDEGSVIGRGLVPGVSKPVALIGIAEKGYASVELTVRGVGGHSSMPPRETAVGALARAIHRLEAHQMPERLDGPTRLMLEQLGPELPYIQRTAVANLWLLGPLIERQLAAAPSTNASIRTTTAPTIFQAGVKDNVLPASARAVVNFRILPGDSIGSVLEHVRSVVNDARVHARLLGTASNPSPVSSTTSFGYHVLELTTRQLFPNAVAAPFLVLGATDSHHYASLTPNVYRFLPVTLTSTDLARVHGTDERVSIKDYGQAIRFMIQLLRTADGNH